MKVLMTGTISFIDSHAAVHLLKSGDEVADTDNISDYRGFNVKKAGLARFSEQLGNFVRWHRGYFST